MITRITGILNRVLDEEARVQVGGLEYQVLVPEFVRRQIQLQTGQEVSLHTLEYLDGNPMQGKVVPRLVGFLHDFELEFFELFCTVDKVGTKKALKALARPVREMAEAISRQDGKWLATLPGIGAATAEGIISTLKKKVTRFAMLAPVESNGEAATPTPVVNVEGRMIEDAYQALLSLGHTPMDARDRLDRACAGGKTYKSVEEMLQEIYRK